MLGLSESLSFYSALLARDRHLQSNSRWAWACPPFLSSTVIHHCCGAIATHLFTGKAALFIYKALPGDSIPSRSSIQQHPMEAFGPLLKDPGGSPESEEKLKITAAQVDCLPAQKRNSRSSQLYSPSDRLRQGHRETVHRALRKLVESVCRF